MLGRVTRVNTCQPLAPRLTAASSSSGPIASITGINSRTTSGSVTNVVASTSPGQEKITFQPSDASVGPSSPCRPKIRTRASPATTGETEKGTSQSVIMSDRPGKRNRDTSQAVAMPKTVLIATASGATVSESQMACRVSGSWARARHQAAGPSANASAKTLASGTTMSRPTTPTARAMSSRSVSGLAAVMVGLGMVIGWPRLTDSRLRSSDYWALRATRCCRVLTTTSREIDIASNTTAMAVASA